uniref:Secreted protein n=1 Tax=Haemonchus contortus TaxID=6289 RepID=A0A7I4Z2G3_HAECO|nr:unnamed protein product [Haemonchus contortus]
MSKRIAMAVFFFALGSWLSNARFLDETYVLASRNYVDAALPLMPITVPRRALREAIENHPLPCRFKLCVTFL